MTGVQTCALPIWGTREARIASLICQRPVYIVRPADVELIPTAARYRLEPILTVAVALGTPTAGETRRIYRVHARDPKACGG